MSTSERVLAVIAALIAILVFLTGRQSLKQWSTPQNEIGPSTRRAAEQSNFVAPAVAPPTKAPNPALAFVGAWEGYNSSFRQIVDEHTGKVTGETQQYDEKPTEQIVVTEVSSNRFEVTHRHKDGSFQGTGPFEYRDGKLVHLGRWQDFYKGAVPTIWRTPGGMFKYEDGVCGLRLERQRKASSQSFAGLWLITSEHLYIKLTQIDQSTFELSEGTGEHAGENALILSDGILWRPPVSLHVVDSRLRGTPPNFLSGDLILELAPGGQLRYTLDFGGGNRKTMQAHRVMDSPERAK